jgi:hypothetical protein
MHILALTDCPRGISALFYDVPFDFVDATSGTEVVVVVGLHTIVLCVLSAFVFWIYENR